MTIEQTHVDAGSATSALPADARKLLVLGQAVAWIGLVLFVGYYLYQGVMAFGEGVGVDRAYTADYLDNAEVDGPFPLSLRFAGFGLDLLREAPGIIALFLGIQLFRRYRTRQMFSPGCATRLRWIGWMVILMAPFHFFTMAAGRTLFGRWAGVESGIPFGLEPRHIHAVVLGSILVLLATIMLRAVAAEEENRGFI